MGNNSVDFEIFIAQVHKLLEGTNATVTWNEKIPDPNNPSQDRQIDITVRKNELFNIIECRHRKNKQDVNWIEELIGRRMSLNASSITGVSSSGFTKGAINKARAYGIILSEIKNVPAEFIINWTRGMHIKLYFLRFDSYKLKLFIDKGLTNKLDDNEVKRELLARSYIHDLSPSGLDFPEIKEEKYESVKFKYSGEPTGINIDGILIKSFIAEGEAYLETISLSMPSHLAYIDPGASVDTSCVIIQNFNFGKTRIINDNNNIALYLDLSQFNVPSYWKFSGVEMKAHSNSDEYFSLLNAEIPIPVMFADDVDLTISTA